jgi:hypothetical protein
VLLTKFQECFASALVAFDTLAQPSAIPNNTGRMIVAVGTEAVSLQHQANRTPPAKVIFLMTTIIGTADSSGLFLFF